MCSIPIAGLVLSAIGTVSSIASSQQQARNQEKIAEYNATVAEVNAMEARERGGQEANQKRQEVKKMMASQSAQMAANGGEISSGTNLNLFGDTAWGGEMDAKTIEVNAMREANGYETQAKSYRYTGQTNAANSRASGYSTLASGTSSLLTKGYDYYKKGELFGG